MQIGLGICVEAHARLTLILPGQVVHPLIFLQTSLVYYHICGVPDQRVCED